MNRGQRRDRPPWRPVTSLASILLGNRCPGELAHQVVEMNSLLILRILTAPVQDTNIDTRIHTPENLAGLGWRQDALTPQHDKYRHLQARKSFVHIRSQVIAEERGHGKASIGLVRTGVDILYQLIGNQTWIVIALAIIIAANSRTRR